VSVLRVACGGSARYLPHHAAMLHSVLMHRGGLDAEVLYLHDAEPSERHRLRAFVEGLGATLRPLEVPPERVRGLPATRYVRAQMWYRILLPELAPDVGRVLYLDGDVLALDSVAPLWATDLAGHPVAAVQNVFEPWNAEHPARLGLAGERAYFNSGVLLLDLDAMRREDATGALREHALAHRDPWPDQDAFNVVFAGRWLPLHPRWNAMTSILTFERAGEALGSEALVREAREAPALRHFEGPGPNKPWHAAAPRADRALYRHHRGRTPWPSVRLEGGRLRDRLRRLRP